MQRFAIRNVTSTRSQEIFEFISGMMKACGEAESIPSGEEEIHAAMGEMIGSIDKDGVSARRSTCTLLLVG